MPELSYKTWRLAVLRAMHKKKKPPIPGGSSEEGVGACGTPRPYNLFLLGWGWGHGRSTRARGQLLQVVLQQADFNPPAAHALGLGSLLFGRSRQRGVAHAYHVDPVNRNFVVLNQVT